MIVIAGGFREVIVFVGVGVEIIIGVVIAIIVIITIISDLIDHFSLLKVVLLPLPTEKHQS